MTSTIASMSAGARPRAPRSSPKLRISDIISRASSAVTGHRRNVTSFRTST